MKAVITAGGKGTRMGYLTSDIPKPMLQIAGKPLIEHQIAFIRKNDIKDVYITLGYLGKIIKDYLGNGKKFDINLNYFFENTPLGTAGGVKQLEDLLSDDFLVLYGDIMLDVKIDDLLSFHKKKGGVAALVVHPNDHPYDSDLIVIDDNFKIDGFLQKNRKLGFYPNLVSAAVYVLSPVVFKFIPKGLPTDFVKDVFPAMLKSGLRLYGYKTAEYIKDMGTLERFEEVSKDFKIGKIYKFSKSNQRPAIFMDRDGTLIREVNLLHKLEDLELYDFSAKAIKKINDSEFLALIITNQPVVARSLCDISTVKKIHNKLETLLGKNGVYLNDIYFCPHHPDKGYPEENPLYKIECECRKPMIGMIKKAEDEYNIDIRSSWFIGDTTTDIQTGINAGLQTVLVRTGKGGNDRKFQCNADFVFDNLKAAVDFIIIDRHKYDYYIKKIINDIKPKDTAPFIISVAGLARTGKSILVKLLTQALQGNGIPNQVVSLDNWLFGINERTDNMTVRERYKYNDIAQDINRLINGKEIFMKRYDPYSRTIFDEGYFSLNNSACLIIDGTPALDIESIRSITDIKVYVELDENIRKGSFFSFYKWKGLKNQDIEHLYRKRLFDEVPFIEESKEYADVVIRIEVT